MLALKNINKSVWIVIVGFTLFLIILNALFPIQSDSLGVGYGGLKAAIHEYMTWNGRFFELVGTAYIHYLAPTLFFSFLNSFVGITFVIALFVLLFGRLPRQYSDSVILTIFICCLLYFSMFGSVFIWASGSFNYLWAYCAIVLVSLPHRLFWNQPNKDDSYIANKPLIFKIPLLLVFIVASFCAGMSNEVGAVLAILIHFIIAIYAIFWAKVKLPFWYILGILAFICGFLALYFSPGQAIRTSGLIESGSFMTIKDFFNMSLHDKIVKINKVYGYLTKSIITSLFHIGLLLFIYERYKSKNFNDLIMPLVLTFILYAIKYIAFFENYKYIASAFLFIVIYFCIYISYKNERNKTFAQLYLYVLIILVIFYIILTSTLQVWLPDRARFFTPLLGIIGYICLYNISLILFPNIAKKLQYTIFSICILYMIFIVSAYVNMHYKWNDMLNSIEQQKNAGLQDIVVSKKTFHSFYKNYGDWENPGSDTEVWPNTIYAKYFGVRTFKTE